MSKVKPRPVTDGRIMLVFECPGCESLHGPNVGEGSPKWTWNGDIDRPTLSPSILIGKDDPRRRCHSFIKDGKIQFLNDSFHKLSGQTVDLPEIDF
jgi:hypothetical protein